jgi:hypothetical protein
MKCACMLAALLLVALALPLTAQEKEQPADNMEIIRDALRAEKKVLVAENMDLTEAEAKAFWPVYEEYQNAMKSVADRRIKLIKDYAANYLSLTDETAMTLVKELVDIQKERIKLDDSFLPKFQKVLPAVKVARYYQLENKIRAVVDYDLARQIPLAE